MPVLALRVSKRPGGYKKRISVGTGYDSGKTPKVGLSIQYISAQNALIAFDLKTLGREHHPCDR